MDLIVLGLDGVDHEFLKEAMQKHEMPNFEEMKNEEFYSPMESTMPAVTIPAWPVMFSGYKPSKFEAYNINMSDFENWADIFPNSSYFRGHTLWDQIDDREFGLHYIPGTFPLYPINGYSRAGMQCPEDFDFYPEKLREELESKGLELEKLDSHSKSSSKDKIEAELENFDLEKKVSKHMMEKDPDVFISVFQVADRSSHFAEERSQILEVYRETDAVLGSFLDKAERQNANLLVVSDHGFMRTRRKFNVIKFLQDHDLAKFKEGAKEPLLYRLFKPLVDTPLKKYLKYFQTLVESKTGVNVKGHSGGYLGSVDKDSKVVPLFTETMDAGLVVHTEDYPHGKVPVDEKEEIVEEIIGKLEELELNGEKAVEEIWRKDEIYPKGESAPDVLFRMKEGVTVSTAPSSSIFDKTKSFTHGKTGIFFAKGPDIDEEAETEVDIYNVAPLLYTLLGKEMPEDIHGELPQKLVPDLNPEYKTREVEDIDI